MDEILYNTVESTCKFRENTQEKLHISSKQKHNKCVSKTARIFESKRRLSDVTKYLKRCLENRKQLLSDCVLSGIQVEDEETPDHRAQTTTVCSTPTDEINAGISIMKIKKRLKMSQENA
jgi:hypothetical protein